MRVIYLVEARTYRVGKAHISTERKTRARIRGENPSILALFVFMNELMLTHHEFSLRSMNRIATPNAEGNSCDLSQFTKAQLSIHATVRLQFIA